MDILITFILLIIAVMLMLKQPLNINITHKYEPIADPTYVQVPDATSGEHADTEQKEKDDPITNLDDVLKTINEILGGGESR